MAFKKKTWKDRLVEFAGRRQLQRVSGDANGTMVVNVTRAEGTVSQAGDAFSAANMNDLEQRIADEFVVLNNNLGGLSFYEDPDGNKYVVGADAVPKKLGSGNKAQVFTASPVDMKKYTDDWASLVAEDFKVGCAGVTATASCHGDVATVSAAPGITLSYDPLNGILTFGISGSTSSSYQQLRLSCTVRSIFAVYLGTVRGALD